MDNQSDIHTRLKGIRIQKGYTQEEIANKLNISRQAVSRWETGKASPDVDNLTLLGEIYGVSVDEILGKEVFDNTEDEKVPQKDKFHLKDVWLIVIMILSMDNSILGMAVSLCVLAWIIIKKQCSKILIVVIVASIGFNFFNMYNDYIIYFFI